MPTIFDVRKTLAMEPDEPTFHDFYINSGSDAGIKKGQYLPVVRQVPVHDPVQNKQQGMLSIPIGKLLIIHVERGLSVARLATELGNDERPSLEFESVMIGDRVDLRGASTDAPKTTKKPKRKTATLEIRASSEAAASEAPVQEAVGTAGSGTAPAPAASAPQPPTASVPTTAPPASAAPTSAPATTSGTETSPARVSQPVPPPITAGTTG